jgi:hypothetical protein
MSIEKRIEKLEKSTGTSEQKPRTWVIAQGEPGPAGIQEGDMVIIGLDEEAKNLIGRTSERVGERLLLQGKRGGEIDEDG